ncbi:hypothetical protein [Rhodococcus marinonascens]|uniref:hypothetical protein n=1 Tax=Rhodococcus marinonascens TaxID=38311 RepID=UPI000A8AC92A|nr:hypothetical protein [Rhodococcus marinonascens]
MNPIDAITSITGHVLIRIGRAIVGDAPETTAPAPIHIEAVHVHYDGPAPRGSTPEPPKLFTHIFRSKR